MIDKVYWQVRHKRALLLLLVSYSTCMDAEFLLTNSLPPILTPFAVMHFLWKLQ